MAEDQAGVVYRIAVATSDGYMVNRHFGRAERFDIYAVGQDMTPVREAEHLLPALCQGGEHSQAAMQARVKVLANCQCVLVSRIGLTAAAALEAAGITPYELPGLVEESLHQAIRLEAVASLYP